MKTKLAVAVTVLFALLGVSQVYAQANAANYVFSTTTSGSFTDMSSGTTQLVGPDQDDTASPVTLIGFDFYLNGARQDRFSVNSNGTLRFGPTAVGTTLYDPLGQAGQSLVTAYGADQRTHAGNGKVHFKVTGSAPNRVLTVEWLNMQADFNSGGTADLTYQLRLSETTGTIESVYGPMTMSAAGAADQLAEPAVRLLDQQLRRHRRLDHRGPDRHAFADVLRRFRHAGEQRLRRRQHHRTLLQHRRRAPHLPAHASVGQPAGRTADLHRHLGHQHDPQLDRLLE
jgi:hypothetical protein